MKKEKVPVVKKEEKKAQVKNEVKKEDKVNLGLLGNPPPASKRKPAVKVVKVD